MSLKTFVHKIMGELGMETGRLLNKIGAAKAIITGIDDALKNPIVDTMLVMVLPPAVVAQFPLAEMVLDAVITDITIGSAIQADIAAATSTEGKLRVFISDMQKYGVARKNMFMQKIESL